MSQTTSASPPEKNRNIDPALEAAFAEISKGSIERSRNLSAITSLMRYKSQLEAFRGLVGRKIVQSEQTHQDKPILFTVLSLACASGEEPASVTAVALDEIKKMGKVLGKDITLMVIGVESDEATFESARRKLAEGFTLRDTEGMVKPEDLKFVNSHLPEVRKIVELRHADMRRAEGLDGLAEADAVFLNAAASYAYSKDPDGYKLFCSTVGNVMKRHAVLFTTDNMLGGDDRFTELPLKDHTILYSKK